MRIGFPIALILSCSPLVADSQPRQIEPDIRLVSSIVSPGGATIRPRPWAVVPGLPLRIVPMPHLWLAPPRLRVFQAPNLGPQIRARPYLRGGDVPARRPKASPMQRPGQIVI
jgi:hypothetical protein